MLKGKTAVVTGCLKGIGRETLDHFAAAGADVFACCQFPTEEFESHLQELRDVCGVQVWPVYFDMTDNNAIRDAARTIQQEHRKIDALVNIAGLNRDAFFQMVRPEDLQLTFQVNFFSQIIFSQYIVKLMLRGGGGSVIFTSSVSGLNGNEGQLAYAASKAALVAAVKTMAEELGSGGVRVNAVAPGLIDTDMYKNVPPEVVENKVKKTDLKRMGKTGEVADTIVFLASDMSSHITGQILRIDGGLGG